MNDELLDCFVVFVRDGPPSPWHPEDAERPVVRCHSYEEAARAREKLREPGKSCVIRYVGQSGGGD